MVEIAQTYLGNIQQDSSIAKLVSQETCWEVCLSQSDRFKGRIHAHTKDNRAIGIVKSRDRSLESGDVFKTESGKFLLVNLREQELLVLDLSTLQGEVAAAKLVRLGHVLGNHHHAIAIQDNKIYVQVTTESKVIEKVITDLQIPELKITYQTQSKSAKITFVTHNH